MTGSALRLQLSRYGLLLGFYVTAAIWLGLVVPRLGLKWFPGFVSPIDESALSAILGAIASGMITLTGIVFSLVLVIIQFGSTNYSPRITRLFARSTVLQNSLGVFTGTFLYSLMAMRTVGIQGAGPVSAFTMWLALVWLLTSIALLGGLVRVFASLTVDNVLAALDWLGSKSIAELYPSPAEPARPARDVVTSHGDPLVTGSTASDRMLYWGQSAYVADYRLKALVALAVRTESVIYLPREIGEMLNEGETLALVSGNQEVPESSLRDAVILSRERTFRKNPKYAIRLLVDTAIRALSPAINDPTTAVQVLDHVQTILHRLGNARLDVGVLRDGSGEVRAVVKMPEWEAFLQLGLTEIMQYGANSLQVQRKLGSVLAHLENSLPRDRVAPVQDLARQRESLARQFFPDSAFGTWAQAADREGLGGGDRKR